MRYLILGVTEARDETGAPLPLGGARLRALLAALALRAGGPAATPVADLVDEVWGDDPPRDAPAALQALVSRLRRALGSRDSVRADPAGGYRLAAAREDVDLHRFTRLAALGTEQLAAPAADPAAAAATLREALSLWRGPALADLPEPARTSHAAPAEARRTRAARDRVEADLRSGATAPAALLPEIEALIHEHPYDEDLRAQQLRALRAAGRSADALAAYERTRRDLAEGLGTDPGPRLRALHAELLQAPAPAPPVPPQPRGNLRPRLTSFVGREPELAALADDLARSRLVTLTGPGGSGKTRLAEHAAAGRPGSGWLVELARLDHPAAVPGAVLSALGLRESSLVAREKTTTADPADLLVEHCAHRSLLLVLDNCEHVIGAAAELAERLLTHCPGVRILATSREPLGVPGEFLRPVEPLPPPTAHRLFADRAASARPGFTPADDPAAVAEICARLDGLPLAIELAAARLRLLTPRQIADRLDDRFRLLTGGARTLLPRQQTLRAVVDWSWDLLDASERAVLARLSVFALVLAEPDGDESTPGMRYRMLETIHEYAAERAAADPAALDAAARRHAAHYLAFAERAEPLMRSRAQLPWIRRVETELDNLRTALDTTLGTPTPDATESAQRIALALGWFWWLRDYRVEGVEWIGRILDRTPADGPEGSRAYWNALHLRILHMFLLAESNRGDHFRTPEYRALAGRIQDIFRQDSPESVRFPGMLWPALGFLTGETADFLADLDRGVANARRHAGDWELGVILMFRAHTAIDTTGGLPTVDADLAELHRIASRVGDRWSRAQVASAAGEMALSRGRYDEARAEYEECLRLAREVGAHTEVPFALARIAEAVYSGGDLDGAERLLAEAEREADRQGGLYDVVAFARLLTAFFALRRGDTARARTACEEARAAADGITGPAQFAAGLATVEAALLRREQGPEAGLAKAAQGLADAVAARCAERFLAALAETAALLLADAGRPAESVRVLAAATAWRAGHPRSVPEEAVLEDLPARTRALLGAAAQAEAEAEGRTLTPAEVAALLAAPAAPAALSGS
ncbi:BTAD domain-containing putative transcriptional regulator [Streptomyces lavendulae]|uniref:BTAD domain-containing putative transcriptional regulator n=1 Tax=Streptomyces lavendulae TaxID=1914 RepID=UPI0004C226F4|nr:BTAD domain-containing putative transcriptional regulator [Streptomyces lavendulae]